MTSGTSPIPNPAESWEAKLKEIQAEESYLKLSPEEQTKKLAEEKKAWENTKTKLKKDLYNFESLPDPADDEKLVQAEFTDAVKVSKESSRYDNMPDLPQKETTDQERADEKKKFEESKKEFENPERMREFLKTFDLCLKYIQEKTDLKFPTYSLDDKGKFVEQTAHCLKLTDHSKKGNLNPAEIAQRLKDKKTHPLHIGLIVEIGNVKENYLSLKNISMEVPLSSLKYEDLISQLKNFTNTVLFAMLCYDNQKKITPAGEAVDKKSQMAKPIHLNETSKKTGLQDLNQGGKVTINNGALDIGDNSIVSFQCNGQVWGKFDLKKAEQNSQKLPEQIENIKREK